MRKLLHVVQNMEWREAKPMGGSGHGRHTHPMQHTAEVDKYLELVADEESMEMRLLTIAHVCTFAASPPMYEWRAYVHP